jgi:predicted esterase
VGRIAFSVARTVHIEMRGPLSDQTNHVWIVLHGYGQSAFEFISLFEHMEGSNRCILAPEGLSKFYLKGVEGKVGSSWMTKQDRASEIEDYLNYLGKVVEYVAEQAPKAKIFLLGFSQGAATAARFYFSSNPKTMCGLVLWGAVFPSDLNFPCHGIKDNGQVHVVYGTSDPYISPALSKTFPQINTRLWPFEGGHELPNKVLKMVMCFLEDNLN